MRTPRLSGIFGWCVVVGHAVLGGNAILAQGGELRRGEVARVTASAPVVKGLVGRLVAVSADTLILETHDGGRVAVPRAALLKVEQRLPNASRTRQAFAWAGRGFLIGGAAGAVVGAATGRQCSNGSDDGFCGPAYSAAGGFIGGGVLGSIAGAFVGLALPVDRWSPIENLTVGVTPRGGKSARALVLAIHR